MDQPEEILEKLERFNVQKNPEITRELNEYVSFVARTGDSVFAWPLVKNLYREKLNSVISEFFKDQGSKELPSYPNVDPFNYETMKKMLIERLDSFNAAPFTIQRISELLADPRKQYSRIDKFMRAVEKNILVVSTVAPGRHRSEESENGDSLDSALNGEFSSDVNVDIDMDNDGSFTMTKEFNSSTHRKEENHEITSVNHETITIKKTASKEEGASTSSIAVDIKTGEAPEGSVTEVSIDSQSTVTITVCEPESKQEDLTDSSGDDSSKDGSTDSNEPSSENPEIKATEETIIPEIIEPKIDDALLNEPLRPADDEILVHTSDIISDTATTPLAALENIVAIRTDPSLIEPVETPRIESVIQSDESSEDGTEPEQSEQKEIQSTVDEDESGIEAKRLKVDEEKVEEPAEEIVSKEEEAEEVKEESEPEKDPIVEEPVETPVEAAPSLIEEPAAIVEEPIATEPIEESPATTTTPAETMETVQITENTMSLDEDEPPVFSEMETAAPVANKMDTDENEGETALMDVDDEPMDQ